MDPQKVLEAPLDDIIFEGRNQAYGAYFLRKIYPRHLFRSLLVALILTIVGTAAPLVANYISNMLGKEEDEEISVEINMENLDLPPEEKNVPPPPPPPQEPPPVKSTIRYVVPEPKKDEEVVDEEPPPPVEELAEVDISNKTQEGADDGVSEGVIDAPPAEEPAPPPVVEEAPPPPTEIFKVVEQMPEFEGGTAGLLKYLAENIKYPAIARENGIEGRVIVQFVVDENGEVSQTKVVRGIGGGCDQEATRVVQTMNGKWKPGKQRGRPVKVWFTLPVNFQLQ
ncbi:MAG: energy transducer TonB [Saprospiraceae bacterium]